MKNITDRTANAVQELIHYSYIMNAKVDRMKSVLNADFAYNETSDIIHKFIAHYFSNGIGDALSEQCLERYNISVIFGDIPKMNQTYDNVEDILKELLEIVVDYQNMLSKCISIAQEEFDMSIASDLLSFNITYNYILEQCILLVDKISLYKDNPSFDAHIRNNFCILDASIVGLDGEA